MIPYYITIKKVDGGYIVDRDPYMKGEKCHMASLHSIAVSPGEVLTMLNEWFELTKEV